MEQPHKSTPTPAARPLNKPPTNLSGWLLLILIFLVLNMVCVIPIPSLLLSAFSGLLGAARQSWLIFIVIAGSAGYFTYTRRFNSKVWWYTYVSIVGVSFLAAGYWLMTNFLPALNLGQDVNVPILLICMFIASYASQKFLGLPMPSKLVDKMVSTNQALELDPYSAVLYCDRALVYGFMQDYKSAFVDLNLAIELDPEFPLPYNTRGLFHYYRRHLPEALADCNRAIELNPQYAEAYNNRGLVEVAMGDVDKAIADYTKAIEYSPTLAEAHCNRGLNYYKRQQYEQAYQDLSQANQLLGGYIPVSEPRYALYKLQKRFGKQGGSKNSAEHKTGM